MTPPTTRSPTTGLRRVARVGRIFEAYRTMATCRPRLDAAGRSLRRVHRGPVLGCNLRRLPPSLMRRGRVVVDVGAYEGWWARGAMDILAPERMILIEPNPDAADGLRSAFARTPGVVVEECAAGAATGRARLHMLTAGDFTSLRPPLPNIEGLYPGVSAVRTEGPEVRVETLDDLLAAEGAVNVLKIDVQGAEADVLDGATDVLRRTDMIVIEVNFVHHYEHDSLFWDLAPMLVARSFELYDLIDLCRQWGTGRALWADAIFVRGDLLGAPTGS